MSCSRSVAQSGEAENDHEGDIAFYVLVPLVQMHLLCIVLMVVLSVKHWGYSRRHTHYSPMGGCTCISISLSFFFFFWSYVQLLWKILKRLCAAHRWTKWVKSVMGVFMKAVNSCLNPVCTITTLQTCCCLHCYRFGTISSDPEWQHQQNVTLHVLMCYLHASGEIVHIPLHTPLFSTEKNGVTTRRNRRRGKDRRASSAVAALRIKCLSDLWMIQKIADTSVIRWY